MNTQGYAGRLLPAGFEVEWCSELFVDPKTGDAQYDLSEWSCRDFADKQSAQQFAEQIAPKADGIQAANIRQFERDRFGQKDYIGELKEVSA